MRSKPRKPALNSQHLSKVNLNSPPYACQLHSAQTPWHHVDFTTHQITQFADAATAKQSSEEKSCGVLSTLSPSLLSLLEELCHLHFGCVIHHQKDLFLGRHNARHNVQQPLRSHDPDFTHTTDATTSVQTCSNVPELPSQQQFPLQTSPRTASTFCDGAE